MSFLMTGLIFLVRNVTYEIPIDAD